MKISNIISSIHTISSTVSGVVDRVATSSVVTTIISNKVYQSVGDWCTQYDERSGAAGERSAQWVVKKIDRRS
jgi:hypothetical protein